MAMSNAERQRKWVEKNRALHNFRRRKKNLSGGSLTEGRQEPVVEKPDRDVSFESRPVAPFETKKVGELRMLVMPEHKPVEEAPVKPLILRDDYGRVISEGQWKRLQEAKRRAKEGGFEIDEYSQ